MRARLQHLGLGARLFAALACVAVSAVLVASAGEALGYFTTYARAEGGYTLELRDQTTTVEEEFANWTKSVSVANTGDAACFVRVRAYAGSQYALAYSDEQGAWSPGADGYWYCATPVEPGAATPVLQVRITVPDVPEGQKPADFNVVVVQESTPALYEADGGAYADWSLVADVSENTYDGQEG